MLCFQFLALEPRLPHLDAKGFGFIAASNSAPIVVGQHHHGPANKRWPKDALARDVEIIAINKGIHDCDGPGSSVTSAWP
jgi:hypothetical protein